MVKKLRVNGDDIVIDEDRPRPVPFHSPSEALQVHCELLDWVDSDEGLTTIGSLMRSRKRDSYARDEHGNPVTGDDESVNEGYRSVLWDTVNHNNTMYVSAHMCDQLQALIPAFENEPLWPTDLPDEKGTVLFEAAIKSVMSGRIRDDMEGDDPVDYWIKGFAYSRIYNQQVESFRNRLHMVINIQPPPGDPEAEADPRMTAFEEHDGIILWPLFDAGEMFIAEGQWEEHGEPPVLPMVFSALPFGPRIEDWAASEGTDIYQMRQIVVTLFRLIWQHILVEEPIPRAERRRMTRMARKRKRLPDDGEEVKVRHLRRLEHEQEPTPRDTEPGEGHPLTYRIIVRGHPRDQHYPSLGPARVNGQWNAESHRRIWISPHIRGPEDAPLVLKHALDAVVR